jgi:hypothetical protein
MTFTEIDDVHEQNRRLVRDAKRRDKELLGQAQKQRASRSSEDEESSSSRPAKRSKYFHDPSPTTPSANAKRRPIVIQDDMEVEEEQEEGSDERRQSDTEAIERPKLGVASSSSAKEGGRNRADWDAPVKSPTKHVAVTTRQMVDLDISDSDENERTHPHGSKKKHGVCRIAVFIRRKCDPYILLRALCYPCAIPVEEFDPVVQCPLCNFKLRHSEVDPHIENGCAQTTKTSGSKAWSDIFAGASGAASGVKSISAKDK